MLVYRSFTRADRSTVSHQTLVSAATGIEPGRRGKRGMANPTRGARRRIEEWWPRTHVALDPRRSSEGQISDLFLQKTTKRKKPFIPTRDERLGFRGTTLLDRWLRAFVVELRGLEPRTSTLPVLRSPG